MTAPSLTHDKAGNADLQHQIESLVHGRHGDPFTLLGQHRTSKGIVVRAFRPDALRVSVIDRKSGRSAGELERLHPAGFFAATLRRKDVFAYRLRLELDGGRIDIEDPYRFGPILGEVDAHLLAEGTHLNLYERLGAHPGEKEGVAGTSFAVWAPNASRVSVVGNFNGWDGRIHPMRRRAECGVWELFLPAVGIGESYKFEIKGPHGDVMPLKADPLAFAAERPPATASIVHGLPLHDWNDAEWMERRGGTCALGAPISIYECHIGSWMREAEENNRPLTYAELSDRLVPYVKRMGFTHIELLPITEFPFEGSWGYQPIGLYAPTSRHGKPEDFAAFVDRCHQEGIGVLLDWVPGHFPSDPHGLGMFDGTHLYEHADPRQGFHVDWNTLIYNYGRREVANFLQANAIFWLRHYHLDGLRVDAVASMLYLDYSRSPDQWIPNIYGGRENLEAIAFLRNMNELALANAPGAMTAAEESTAWPGVSRPISEGGLGFGYKWNMGWMHDTLDYIARDPLYRSYHHNSITFGLHYAFSENFILPLSHDEVVHGKGSLVGKMPGDTWQRFASLRAYLGFMFSHPGKKLLFMGGELAQVREWNHDAGLDWHLLDDPFHEGVQHLVRDLNHAYRGVPALHERDCDPQGFSWVVGDDHRNCVYAFLRHGHRSDAPALVVCNFTPVPLSGYRVGVPVHGTYHEVVNTDAACYGGSNVGNGGQVATRPVAAHGHPYSLELTLPPLATLILERGSGHL